MAAVVWFRRDLRLGDHGALAAAAGDEVVPLFVLDPALWQRAGAPRRHHLGASLRDLDHSIRDRGGVGLLVRHGSPADVVPEVAAAAGAETVWVTADYAPYGIARDRRVAEGLAQRSARLRSADSPYLHHPGAVTKADGSPFAVFTPYHRSWRALPLPAPVATVPRFGDRLPLPTQEIPAEGDARAGEAVATAELDGFVAGGLVDYDRDRNRPDLTGTSGLSAALHFGEVHPRTVVAAAGPASGFVRQLCWRDFYADVLYRRPDASWGNVDRRFDALPWRDDQEQFRAWCEGMTGYPMVDAGMRQLRDTGWMHNRVRMITASFLTKDLLLPWQWGARWFLTHLRDGDVANNSLGWQWCAGTGTDPSPYYRIFNPVLQGLKFDPDGDYVRRFVPELAHLPGASAHEPWDAPGGYDHGYPRRLVDHKEARAEALAAYEVVRAAR